MSISSPFPHPWWTRWSSAAPPYPPKDDWFVYEFVRSIRAKPNWESKILDEALVEKWKNEARLQSLEKTKNIEEVLDYAFKELSWYRRLQEEYPGLSAGGFKIPLDDKITVSDTAVSDTVRQALLEGNRALRESFAQLDYHPGSKNQVVDLVHPSLYCLQYGVTPVFSSDGVKIHQYDEAIAKVKKGVVSTTASKKYQWLPSVFEPSDTGFHIKSYINNLHPVKFHGLYETIEQVFNAAAPGLAFTLARFASPRWQRVKIDGEPYAPEFKTKMDMIWEELRKDADETGTLPNYDKFDVFNASRLDYLLDFPPKWEKDPETVDFDLKSFDHLKVIVKMADIELTPDNPTYGGGSWHVEGGLNEDIVATILYYYDMDNITESRLSFRDGYDEPDYEQDDDIYLSEIYGIKDEEPLSKVLGSVEAQQNRLLIFPNGYQHHVDPFELADKTKNGHRRILCFFVCDPYDPHVVATDKVPPQQEEWWSESIGGLSQEVKEQILKLKGDQKWPLSLDDTKVTRADLMEERSAADDLEEGAFTMLFSLCEH